MVVDLLEGREKPHLGHYRRVTLGNLGNGTNLVIFKCPWNFAIGTYLAD